MRPLSDPRASAHRPWPLPRGSWAIHMVWHDLAFLHWPVDPALLEAHLPQGLELDTFGGTAWLGVVPFRMSGVRPRFTPSVPGVSSFPEINLRTYVRAEDKPGVWFFSLDVPKRLAVHVARTAFHLPYFRSHMRVEERAGAIRYVSRRARGDLPGIGFAGSYRPLGEVFRSEPGSLEEFLTERYCLYAASAGGRLYRGEIHHEPWPLQLAEAEFEQNDLALQVGIASLEGAPLVHFARELEVVAWRNRAVTPH